MKKKMLVMVLVVVMVFGLVACGGAKTKSKENEEKEKVVETKKSGFVIGFSNGYFGNTWRSQLVDNFEKAADKYKEEGVISDYIVSNTSSDVTEQNNQLNAMIDKGVDALLIDAASPTSIKAAVDAALKKGILVIIANDPAAYEGTVAVCGNNTTWQEIQTKWLAEQLKGKGNIVEISGEPGNAADTLRQEANKAVLKDYPDIKTLTSVPGKWSETEAQSVMTTILSSYDEIDAVLAQDVMAEGIIKAYESAGKDVTLMTGDYTKSFLQKWNEMPTLESIGVPYAPGISVTALDVAIKLLQGGTIKEETFQSNPMDTSMKNTILVDPPYVVTREVEKDAPWMEGLVGTKAISLEDALKLMEEQPETAALDGYLTREEVASFFE